ncbi:MAG: HDIG domain-containing protein [Nitrospiraceae bacterium]|nr:HDIG domain-containing protein [Nitrospiraceae bacterium]
MPSRREAAFRICGVLRRAGHRALLAGGCVRDDILGVEPHDYDIATSARPEAVARLFDRCIEVGASYGVQLVLQPEAQFEVATFRRDGPYGDNRHPDYVEYVDEEEDARRRDFTVNALFYDPETSEVIDHVGGRDDLERGILRAVGEPRKRFAEDHLRLLRAIRFATRLDYTIEPATWAAICDMAPLVNETSAERIRDEILKGLTEGHARTYVERLDESGILERVLPEVAAMKSVEQPAKFHPEGDVFVHTLLMLEHMDMPSPTLALGVLLHDAGKPRTQTFEDRIRFNNHDKAGARMAEAICRRLRIPNADAAQVAWLVENHMRLAAVPNMRESKRKRFVRHEGFDELLELCRLDCLASHRSFEIIDWVREYLNELPAESLRPEPLLRGHDLIAMGYAPGPLFTEILHAVEDAQLDGTLTTREEAQAFVGKRWPD